MTKNKKGISALFFLILALCIFAVLISDADIAIGYMRKGLLLCAKVVVPSLFPFMVLSGLFVELGCADLLARFLSRPMRFLFGISGAGSAAPLMGALCGFPIGASTAHKLLDCGRISREEMTRLLTFSNIPGSAFLISAVGSALWSNPTFGTVLYVIQILAAVIIGVFLRLVFPLKKSENISVKNEQTDIGIRTFSKVVSESAISMLNVCALVLFFASFVGALVSMLEGFGIEQGTVAVIYGFFEMSGAVGEAAKVLPRELGLVLTALICGWSGLSIHFQVISVCSSDGVSFVPYFCAKAAQGILSALGMLFYIKVIDPSLPSLCVPALASSGAEEGSTALAIAANAVLMIGVILYFLPRRARKSCGHGTCRTK
ncbi:MAG: hypothetical protein IJZ89_01640 [Clostridia bacterium]|nr:hypothetical protein [Clostridia bacterium]